MEDNLSQKLTPVFARHPSVKVVYLFGSRATGQTGPQSDYDFAISLDERESGRMEDTTLAIVHDLSLALGRDDVDVVIMNTLEKPEMKYDIITQGRVLYEQEPYRVLLEPRILSEYFDFRDLLRRYGLTRA